MQSRAASRSRTSLALFWIPFVVSAAVKLSRLNSRELWLDETYSAYMAAAGFRQIIHASAGDLNPPLYHLLLHIWAFVAGTGPAQLRLFSVILSILTTAAVYLLGRRIVGPIYGALASALFAFAPMLFVYSLEVRSYFLLILLVSIVLNLHWQVVVERTTSKPVLAAYAIVAASLFYVHYLSVFVLVALILHGLLTAFRHRELLPRLLLAVVAALILMAPGFHLLSVERHNAAVSSQRLALAENDPQALLYHTTPQGPAATAGGAREAAAALGFFPARSKALLLAAAIPLLLLLLGVLYLALAQADLVCRLFLLVAACLETGLLLLHANETRYLLLLLPLLVIALARTVQFLADSPTRRPLGMVAACAVLAIYIAGFARQATRTHGHIWANSVAALRANYQPDDLVVFDAAYSEVPFDYFAHLQHFTPREQGYPESIYQFWREQDTVQGWGGPLLYRPAVDRFADSLLHLHSQTVWVVVYEPTYSDPHNLLLERLKASAQVTEVPLPPDPDAQPGEAGLHLLRVQPAS